MDSKRFDDLILSLARGASRRTVLKGLLGLGSAAAISERADARSIGTRPTFAPKPITCVIPKQMCGGVCCDNGKCKDGHCCPNATDAWCEDKCCPNGLCTTDGESCCTAGQKVCGDVCCHSSDSCAIDGNNDICCDPATHYPCGLECCDEEFQCCDGECCEPGSVCLVRVYGGEGSGPPLKEEHCCPAELTCGGTCCDGECFDPEGRIVAADVEIDRDLYPDAWCCPAGGEVCQGSDGTLCCPGGTKCCLLDGVATCIADDACCDCGACQDCVAGVCVNRCATCEVCEDENCFPCGGEGGGVCCDGVCERESECCDDPDCVGRYENGDEGCIICVSGTCQRLGDDTGGPDCVVDEETTGSCCLGMCLPPGASCAFCAGYGASCDLQPCCEGLFCDPLANLRCTRRCQICDDNGENCRPHDNGTVCILDTFEAGECCSGECVPENTCVATTTTAAPACDPPCTTGQLCCPGPTGNSCVPGTICPIPDCDTPCPAGQQCCLGGYCIDEEDTCCLAAREEIDCSSGLACCGGRCELGECCTGIADDGRCGDGNSCCPGVNGNACVPGLDCSAPSTTTSTPACLPDFAILCDGDTQCCSGECRETQASLLCGVGEIQPFNSFCCGREGTGCEGTECCCAGLVCQVPESEFFGLCVATTTTTLAPVTTTSIPLASTTTLAPCPGQQVRCSDGQCYDCCNSSDCVEILHFDTNCVFCTLTGTCSPAGLLGNSCGTTGNNICDENGQCVECIEEGQLCNLFPGFDPCCAESNLVCDVDGTGRCIVQ